MIMLDAVYVATVDEKRIVAIRTKPAFWPLLEIAATREGSDIVLVHDRKEDEGWRSVLVVETEEGTKLATQDSQSIFLSQ